MGRRRRRDPYTKGDRASLFLESFDLIVGAITLIWRIPVLLLRLLI